MVFPATGQSSGTAIGSPRPRLDQQDTRAMIRWEGQAFA